MVAFQVSDAYYCLLIVQVTMLLIIDKEKL